MPKDLFSRYIWLVDTIRSHGTITRSKLDEQWMRSPYSNGEPMPRRTFYNYRNAIAELFKIEIGCNLKTFEYYIANSKDPHDDNVTDWLLNSAAMSNALTDAREVAERVFLEDVPSSRQCLGLAVRSLKENKPLKFDYSNYARSKPTKGVVVEPYFLKIFRQRWYVTGRNVAESKIKTYALDRMSSVSLVDSSFAMPSDFDPETYFKDSFGIIFSKGEVKEVKIRVDSQQAKYLRELPLHHSQLEMVHDRYSIFTYRLRLTADFVSELLSYGPRITVIAPAELRAMVVTSLKDALKNYED